MAINISKRTRLIALAIFLAIVLIIVLIPSILVLIKLACYGI